MGILVVSLESYLCRLDIKRTKIRKIVKKIDDQIVTSKAIHFNMALFHLKNFMKNVDTSILLDFISSFEENGTLFLNFNLIGAIPPSLKKLIPK